MLRKTLFGLMLCSAIAGPAYASQSQGSKVQGTETKGSFEFGYLQSSGNSQSSSTNLNIDLGYKTMNWNDTLKLGAIGATDNGDTTQERYTGDGKAEYNLTDYDYLFGELAYTKDLYGGIRQRISETAGYGRRLINSPNQSLDAQIGAGLRQTQEQKPSLERHNEAIATGGLDYQYDFNENSAFEQQLSVEAGRSNTFLESITSLKLTIVKNFFAKLSYTVDHNTNVSDDLKKTDTYTAISVGYSFDTKQ